MSVEHGPLSATELADRVLDHPSVVRLHAGRFGEIATPLPGRTVSGVRLPPGRVEIGVVLRLDRPLPEITAELRETLAGAVGELPVDIVVADVITTEE